MSYILDALKKSENERRAGLTPGLAPGASYVVLPQHRSHHRGAALLVAAGMLGTGLALGNWRSWQEDMAGMGAPLAAPVAVSVPTPAPVVTAAERPLPAKSRSGGAAKGQPAVTPKASTVVEKKKSLPPSKNPPVVVAIAAPAAASAAAGRTPAGAPNPPALPASIAAAKPTMMAPPTLPAAARVALPVAVAAPAALTPAPVPRVVAYRELPPAVQSALPNIVFGGFAGGGEADGRIAFINNRLVREGEEVSPGLRLETVDQNGVVLGFQGHHFRTAQ